MACDGALPGGERDLGVDHQVALFWQAHDHVRSRATSVFSLEDHLHIETAPALQTRQFQQPLQCQFPPNALAAAVALERAGEVCGLGGDLLIELAQRQDFGVGAGDALGELAELFAQRGQHAAELLFAALVEVAGLFLQHALGQLGQFGFEAFVEVAQTDFVRDLLFLQTRFQLGAARAGGGAVFARFLQFHLQTFGSGLVLGTAFGACGKRGALVGKLIRSFAQAVCFRFQGGQPGVEFLRTFRLRIAFVRQRDQFAFARGSTLLEHGGLRGFADARGPEPEGSGAQRQCRDGENQGGSRVVHACTLAGRRLIR